MFESFKTKFLCASLHLDSDLVRDETIIYMYIFKALLVFFMFSQLRKSCSLRMLQLKYIYIYIFVCIYPWNNISSKHGKKVLNNILDFWRFYGGPRHWVISCFSVNSTKHIICLGLEQVHINVYRSYIAVTVSGTCHWPAPTSFYFNSHSCVSWAWIVWGHIFTLMLKDRICSSHLWIVDFVMAHSK